jgi:hypothetical protein
VAKVGQRKSNNDAGLWPTVRSTATMPTYRRVHCAHDAAAVGQIVQARCARYKKVVLRLYLSVYVSSIRSSHSFCISANSPGMLVAEAGLGLTTCKSSATCTVSLEDATNTGIRGLMWHDQCAMASGLPCLLVHPADQSAPRALL